MTKKIFRSALPAVLAASFAAAVAMPGPAGAAAPAPAEPHLIGTFKDWSAFTYMEKGAKVCYMASRPRKSDKFKGRGEVYLLVTQRPAEKSLNVVSYVAGYAFKPGSDVTVDIGKDSFHLFTDGDTAWARDAATDKAIVDAIAKGNSLVAKGTTKAGSATTDDFGLDGSSAAYGAINKACGVKG